MEEPYRGRHVPQDLAQAPGQDHDGALPGRGRGEHDVPPVPGDVVSDRKIFPKSRI